MCSSRSRAFRETPAVVRIVNQPAGRDAGGGLDSDTVEKFVCPLDFFAHVRQAAIFFVPSDVVRVNGHDDAAQAVVDKAAQVFLAPQTAVGADHRMNPALGGVARHRPQIAMHHRLAADKKQIPDVIFQRDVHDAFCFVERDTATCLGIKFRAREAAEVTVGIADVRNSEL